MVDYMQLYLKNNAVAIELSRLFGIFANDYLEEQGIEKYKVFFCDDRQCRMTIQVCTICDDSAYCQSIPLDLAKCLPNLISLWYTAETLTLKERGVKMAKKKKKKKVETEELPVIKKKKKKGKAVEEKSVTNGDIQTIIKAVNDLFSPMFESISKALTELEEKQVKTTETLKTYKPILQDVKQVIENLVGEEVSVTSGKSKKTENKQVSRSAKKKETTEKKLNRKTALGELEIHLHDNDLVLDQNDVAKFIAKRIGESVEKINQDSIREYIVRAEKHSVPVEDLKVIEYHEDWYAYCECCFDSTDEVIDNIDESYYE
jgi:hypothetical protein